MLIFSLKRKRLIIAFSLSLKANLVSEYLFESSTLMQMDELNCQEAKLVEEFRSRMKNDVTKEWYEDIWIFYRFLKARNFDVDEAENMLRKHLLWRKLLQIDTILTDFKPREFFLKYVEPGIIGFDKDGDLVMYWAAGTLDSRENLKCEKMGMVKKYISWVAEKSLLYVKNHSIKKGRNAMRSTLIIDLNKLTLRNVTSRTSAEVFLHLTYVLQDNYPEYLKAVYVINAPSYYIYVFAVVKVVMSTVVLRKIQIFGHSGWKEELLKGIDADLLPAFLGGNRTDPDGDPLCRSFIRHGGNILPEYYLRDEERYFKDRTRVTTIVIPSSKKKEIHLHVKEPEQEILWEFYSKSYINFGLFYEASDQELEVVIPVEKYHTVDGTEKGSYKVRKAGKYIIVFDNTNSWLTSKEVEYFIDVV